MSDTVARPAALVEYVEAQLSAGQSIRAFCAARPGLDPARLSAWRTAKDVSIDHMREFGSALGLNLGQVMVIAGYGRPDDFGVGAKPPAPPKPVEPNIDDAIELDPSLSDEERLALRIALGMIRETRKTGRAARKTVRKH